MRKLIGIFLLLVSVVSCRDETEIFIPEVVPVSIPEYTSIQGFYLLNEGNMGSNKSTLDYFDYETGKYNRNIYALANPTVPKELGDVGNDIKIYGSKLYVVINCSNKYVAKVDTATYQVIDRCLVGFQPDELEIVGNKIYIANSGGYMFPNYENTVSVIDAAANRLYYACYYAVSALLIKNEHEAHTHSGVIGQLGQFFVQTNIISKEFNGSYKPVQVGDSPTGELFADLPSAYL